MMNCLAYALRFWEKNRKYNLFYNHDHVVNSDTDITGNGWAPAEDYGYCYFSGAFEGMLDEHEQELLKQYFKQ